MVAFSLLALIIPHSSLIQSSKPPLVKITIHSGQLINRFDPAHALGAALDGHEKGELDQMLSPHIVEQMLSAGLKPLSYRLRTELAGEAWHWNPSGSWSGTNRGYWKSEAKPGFRQPAVSYGYRLPRRGNTFDQANDDGYSRVDDGDAKTFWKSNPYLDRHFSGEPNATLPQWIMIDFGVIKPINAIRLNWAEPFATNYEVQFGNFSGVDDISQTLPDRWQTFPNGEIRTQHGGIVQSGLSTRPVATRFIRVLMKESSESSGVNSSDLRDHVGYAIREIFVGTLDGSDRFHDEIKHATDNSAQTPIYVSSTDPWHRANDKDPLIEQATFDRVFKSGLTNRMPMLTPIALIYDTPENAAAELRYLKARGYPVTRMELGEEPDGQFITPEDYGALYIQFANALHAVDPNIKLGGPSFQDIAEGKEDWLARFVTYLKGRGHLDDYTFSSFEWYPFDDVCQPTGPQLREASELLAKSFTAMRNADPRKGVPWIMTEYGYSAFAGRVEMDIEGALLNADAAANFLSLGGEQSFLYGYEPNEVLEEVECSQGNNMLFLAGEGGRIAYRMPTYYAAALLTQEWTKLGGGEHELYRVTSDDTLIASYAVRRPDNLWAVLLVNKDPDQPREIKIEFENAGSGGESLHAGFSDNVDVYQYSRKQYELGADYHPIRDLPPEHQQMKLSDSNTIILPAYSLTVVRSQAEAGKG